MKANVNRDNGYIRPQIVTLAAADVVSALGPASAGSTSLSSQQSGLNYNTNSCGFSLGHPCP